MVREHPTRSTKGVAKDTSMLSSPILMSPLSNCVQASKALQQSGGILSWCSGHTDSKCIGSKLIRIKEGQTK